MIETDRQLQIVKQIIAGGGHAYKASNAYTSGILDLAAWVPGFAPVVIEVKDLGTITTKNGQFKRKVNTTRLQKDTMNAVNRVAGQVEYPPSLLYKEAARNTVAFVMVTWKLGRDIYVASIPASQECISSENLKCATRLNELSKLLPLHLKAMGVPLI